MDVLEIVALFVGMCLVVALPLVALLRWAEVVSARRERRAGSRSRSLGSLGSLGEPAVDRRSESSGVGVIGQPT